MPLHLFDPLKDLEGRIRAGRRVLLFLDFDGTLVPIRDDPLACELSAENFHQLYVPPGLLHGFCVLSPVAQVEYKCTTVYDPAADFSVRWNDPELAIPWPIADPVLSAKDAAAPLLRDVRPRLIPWSR